MISEELKSCPFCNGKAKFEVIDTRESVLQNATRFIFAVKCGECDVELSNSYTCDVDMDEFGEIHTHNGGRYDAVKAWNRRADNDKKA